MEVNSRTNKGGQGDGVYLDFSKAFDKMLYMRLLMKMRANDTSMDRRWAEWQKAKCGGFLRLAAGD